MTENEIVRKDKMIDDLLAIQQEAQGQGKVGGAQKAGKVDAHHLVVNLKRKVRDQQMELSVKKDEVELLKRNLKKLPMYMNCIA